MSASIKAAAAAISAFEDAAPSRLRNLTAAAYYEIAVARGEGEVAADGPLVVKTGEHTGRSAQDKFTVRHPEIDAKIWWDNS
ncbi:MAG: phosphoenolpyruvate carboxykinase (ATP), partial [Pseudomonadota bacterium]